MQIRQTYLIPLGLIGVGGITCYLLSVIAIGLIMPHSWSSAIDNTQVEPFKAGVIRFQEEGEGARAVVMLHGFNSELSVWGSVWNSMAGCTHALRLDIPGFGRSLWNTNNFDLASQEQRLASFLAARKLQKVILVGTSMGASLAASFSAHYPLLVEQLILLAPSGVPGSLTYGGVFGALIAPGPVNRYAIWIADSWLYRRIFPRSIAMQSLTVASSYTQYWLDSLPRIKAPTLVFWSLGDEIVPYSYSAQVQQGLGAGRLVTLEPAAGHNLPKYLHKYLASLLCSMGNKPGAISQSDLNTNVQAIFGPQALLGKALYLQ